jgi:pimeloyl-ACP methyl ester carboxylesterase
MSETKLNRRDVLGVAAGGIAATAVTASAEAQTQARDAASGESKTFVLVAGTWHGGWAWKKTRKLMQAAGHDVYTPTVTGVGERSHLANPNVGLETHITDIMNVIEYEELDNVILVGHSFAGITVTGVADRMRDRIRRIVFFDAVVPFGDRMSGGPDKDANGQYPEWWRKREEHFIDGYMMNFFAEYPFEMLVPKDDAENIAWLKRRITPHPAKQWTDKLVLRNGGWEGLPRTFIHCVAQEYSQTSDRMVGPARGEGWQYVAFPHPRNAFMTHPRETADLLMSLT